MPNRNGRWVSWADIEAERKAAKAAASPPAPDKPAVEPQGRVHITRRSQKAALAAVADATGIVLPDLGDVKVPNESA